MANEVVATISMGEANSCNFREIPNSSLNWGIGLGRTKLKTFPCESSFVVD